MKQSRYYLFFFFFLCSLAGYTVIGYDINRSRFGIFIAIYAALFLFYFLSVWRINSRQILISTVIAALLFRAALLFSLPTLSDDFYRFVWDGHLLVRGINPFAHTPQFYMHNGLPSFLSARLFNHLSALSQVHYTIYPAVCQYLFGLAAAISSTLRGNVIAMKAIMLAFEAGSFWVIKKLLEHYNLPPKYLLLYALNPLIILELTGNLHFEGIMIFFLLASFYLFLKNRSWLASLCFLLAVNTKLIPLILLPYLVFSLPTKRWISLICVIVFGTVLLHIPFLGSEFLSHFGDSLALYFQSFEFNGSLYYVARWVGYQWKGYDVIHTAAPVLAAIATAGIILISWKKRDDSLKNLPLVFIIILTIYYFFSTTVHPWYIATLIAFAPLACLYFPLAWSAVIPLTYIAYMTPAYNENLWLVAVEYLVVAGVIAVDLYRRKQPESVKVRDIFDHSGSRNNIS